MDPTTRFLEILERLCRYPGMYVPCGTIADVKPGKNTWNLQ
jgi:hypothetical protein